MDIQITAGESILLAIWHYITAIARQCVLLGFPIDSLLMSLILDSVIFVVFKWYLHKSMCHRYY